MSKFLLISLFLIYTSYLNAKNIDKLVWPEAPDKARIEFVKIATNPAGFEIEKGFFSKIFDFVVGEEKISLASPFGIYAQKKRVYVTDVTSKSVYIFDKAEDETIVIEGSDKEIFLNPIDVVCDSKGKIYISDSIRAKIYVFKRDGEFDYVISSKFFKRPVGIAVNYDENKLYIVDAVASQIHVTTLKGKFLYSIGGLGNGDGEFNRPTFIAKDVIGNIYVTDSMNHRVQVLNKEGKYLYKFGHLGKSIGSFASPRGIALDKNNNIYVSDTMFNNIQIFNKKGELLMVFGGYGNAKGRFSLAEDIFILQNGIIYITDTSNKRVQVFKLLDID